MSTTPAPQTQQKEVFTAKTLFEKDEIKNKFKEMLGKRSTSFITSVLQIVASNELLKKADPVSIYQAAAVAATLDLPLNNSLGFAYIVPYNAKQPDGSFKQVAQFQLGYKGFIQLAQRSGQFLTIGATHVTDKDVIKGDRLLGQTFEFSNEVSQIVGYVAYFKLLNGFEKSIYMRVEDLKAHGVKYSQTFKKGFGLWKDDFDAMATKTVLKLLLAKYAPLSVDMQRAVITDQSVVNDAETMDVTYSDNEELKPLLSDVSKTAEKERVLEAINRVTKEYTPLDLAGLEEACFGDEELISVLSAKRKSVGV